MNLETYPGMGRGTARLPLLQGLRKKQNRDEKVRQTMPMGDGVTGLGLVDFITQVIIQVLRTRRHNVQGGQHHD